MANTKSLDLEATSSQHAYISDASQTGLDLASDFTLEAWVKVEATGGDYMILSKGKTGAGSNASIDWHITSTNKINLRYWNAAQNSTAFQTTDAVITDTNWHHIAATVDISGAGILFYIDGSLVDGTAQSQLATSIIDNAENFYIGTQNEGGSLTYYFDGLIDEVRVWSDIRTAQEISDNYQTEIDGGSANLVAYWKFNDSAVDETTNNNDLTLVNDPVYSSEIPWGLADLDINIYDSISVAEDITKMLEINSSVYDSISIAENITPENTELGPVSVYDSISIAEDITSRLEIDLSLYDSISVAENVTAENTELGPVSVYDSISIAENISNSIDLGEINVFDAIMITESIDLENIFNLFVYDSISISENINSSIPDLGGISVYDEITITENISNSEDLGEISVLETITISENINIATENNVSVYDSIAISENVSASIHLGNISVYDSITIAESVTTFVADPRTGFIGLSSRQQSYPLGFDIRIEDRPLKFRSKQQNYPLGMEDSRTL